MLNYKMSIVTLPNISRYSRIILNEKIAQDSFDSAITLLRVYNRIQDPYYLTWAKIKIDNAINSGGNIEDLYDMLEERAQAV